MKITAISENNIIHEVFLDTEYFIENTVKLRYSLYESSLYGGWSSVFSDFLNIEHKEEQICAFLIDFNYYYFDPREDGIKIKINDTTLYSEVYPSIISDSRIESIYPLVSRVEMVYPLVFNEDPFIYVIKKSTNIQIEEC